MIKCRKLGAPSWPGRVLRLRSRASVTTDSLGHSRLAFLRASSRSVGALGTVLLAGVVVLAAGACSSSSGDGATGGRATGGMTASGGATGGGQATGGAASGGATGGTATGGAATGGLGATAGKPTGGTSTGGSVATGGAANVGGGGGQGGAMSGGKGGHAAGGGGSSATGGGAGQGGDAGGFSPCPPAGTDCAVMPLGDSITDGFGTPGGYRIPLFTKMASEGRRLTFVGRNMNGPDTVQVGATAVSFPRHHEGYSGYTIDPLGGRQGISPLVDDAIKMGKPHIILLQIGTNDIDLDLDVANAPTRLGALLDKIVADAPNALLVLAKITPLNYDAGNVRVRAYNDAMPALVAARVAKGKHILLVDNYAPFVAEASFKTSLLADQWHPNPQGYSIMASVWSDAIRPYLR